VSLKQFPRAYSVDARTRRALDAFAMTPLGLVMAFSLLDVAGLVHNAPTPLALFAMGFLALLCGLLLSRSAHRRVILYEDGIEVLGWFSTRQRDSWPSNGGIGPAKRSRLIFHNSTNG
jgi:hypothetical protein